MSPTTPFTAFGNLPREENEERKKITETEAHECLSLDLAKLEFVIQQLGRIKIIHESRMQFRKIKRKIRKYKRTLAEGDSDSSSTDPVPPSPSPSTHTEALALPSHQPLSPSHQTASSSNGWVHAPYSMHCFAQACREGGRWHVTEAHYFAGDG